jgi:hypothetical protein
MKYPVINSPWESQLELHSYSYTTVPGCTENKLKKQNSILHLEVTGTTKQASKLLLVASPLTDMLSLPKNSVPREKKGSFIASVFRTQ